MNVEIESSIIGAAITGAVALFVLGIELWFNRRAQRKYFVDTHIVVMLEQSEKNIRTMIDIALRLAGHQGTFFERSSWISQLSFLSGSIQETLIISGMLKKNVDFQQESKELIDAAADLEELPPVDASEKEIAASAKKIQRFVKAIIPYQTSVDGSKIFKLDELSGHKNRNRITKWDKVKKWFKKNICRQSSKKDTK